MISLERVINMKPNTIEVGNRIRRLRKERGLTMVELGKIVEAPQSAISNWEKGDNLPNPERLTKLSTVFNITVDELLHGNKEQFIRQTAIELIRQYREEIRNGAPGKEAYLERYGEELSKHIVNMNLDYLLEVDRERVADTLQELIDNHIENAYTSPEDYFNSTFELEIMLYYMRRDAGLDLDLISKDKEVIEGVDVEVAKQVISIIQDAINKINELRMQYGLENSLDDGIEEVSDNQDR